MPPSILGEDPQCAFCSYLGLLNKSRITRVGILMDRLSGEWCEVRDGL